MNHYFKYDSPLGKLLISTDENSLVGIWFDGQKHFPNDDIRYDTNMDFPIFGQTVNWLDIYFSGKQPTFTPPLSLNGSQFRQSVWQKLLQIHYGTTTTYGQIARQIQQETGKRMSAQAVGGAIGHNPISIIVPCHRVVGADGSVVGYAGGTDKKVALLQIEKITAKQ